MRFATRGRMAAAASDREVPTGPGSPWQEILGGPTLTSCSTPEAAATDAGVDPVRDYFQGKHAMKGGLGKAGVSAVKWSAISTVARFALQLVSQIILARLLGPDNYGIFGIGMMVLLLSNFLSNFGFAWNLLHRPTVTDEDIRFAFTWQVMIGLVSMSVVFLAAPWIADYFRDPRVLPVIRWLSLVCFLAASSATANILLQRALNFRAVGIIQILSYAVAYLGFGIPMALLGAGYYSLVAACVVQAAVQLVANYWAYRHTTRPLFSYAGSSAAFSAGGTVFLTNIVNWWLSNMDRIIIGRLLNAHSVGLYSVAYNLATMPNTLLLGALQSSFMSAAAQMSGERERLQRAFLQILATIWILGLPVFAIMATLSFDLVAVLYGPRWAETGWLLSILLLGMPAFASWGVSTPILWNTNRKNYEFLMQLPVVLLGSAALYLWTPLGVRAVGCIVTILFFLRMMLVTGAALKALDLKFSVLAGPLARGLALTALGVSAALVGPLCFGRHGAHLASLVLGGCLATMVFVAAVLYLPHLIGDTAAQMLVRFSPKLGFFWQARRRPLASAE
ncbi:oligosaccharide flippase family protein [Xylophilus rhododendri]|uniref:Oligosaccharide flippase family protein n=1 Tax=Xylophilus rhododendri TaxID=2697032 RepID=A0A857JA13_9BURK|nr:lipopolysaccharide biosynthesis protein [Xylophilus rhododendri]QHI99971.1 oligosaccharide flippase family protein [Xylophilus rhododendri]